MGISYNVNTGVTRIKSRVRQLTNRFTIVSAALVGGLGIVLMPAASAATTSVIVTPPLNSQGWTTNDTTAGGTVSFNNDTTAPGNPHNGALQLSTTASTDKAQYFHGANDALASLTELSYSTKQNAPAGNVADPAYQLSTFLNGTSGFTTLVFEPYQNVGNNGNAAVTPGVWQNWDVDQGLFWSTRTVICSQGTINGTAGGPATYTLAEISATCPEASVFAFGVNVGSNNAGYNVETDLVNFNGTEYNFEPYAAVTDKDACKGGGWMTQTDASGNHFKNQGACVSFVASGGKSEH